VKCKIVTLRDRFYAEGYRGLWIVRVKASGGSACLR